MSDESHDDDHNPLAEWLTIPEVAGYMELSEKTVERMIHDGRLAGFKHGRRWRVARAEMTDYAKRKETEGAKERNRRARASSSSARRVTVPEAAAG